MKTISERHIPNELLDEVEQRLPPLPFKERGISIDKALIRITLEILNDASGSILPQNCRNDIAERTPDGLDRRIKERTGSNLRTANIISDVLERVGIVKICKMKNFHSDRKVKATMLLDR